MELQFIPLRVAEFSAESVWVGVGGLARVLGDMEAAPQLLLPALENTRKSWRLATIL